ncbi:hypothetical protein NDU88_005242 [Pleurodeles waltl]|uniref:Uncharacterized protein n=1 Tax=Pleurodeles waltl TaxID=8319 RepID=A0AAV7LKK8_PLEWA|nr:hypothetical protein NDU88_005242 [Pleurodeles waltl]
MGSWQGSDDLAAHVISPTIKKAVGICDGLAGTRPHTPPTCAAGGVREHHRTTTNGRGEAGSTWEVGGIRRSASAPQKRKENGEERVDEEGERDGGVREREDDMANTPGRRTLETGEWFVPDRGIEDDEAAIGDRNNAVTWEAEHKLLPRFRRSVAYPGV